MESHCGPYMSEVGQKCVEASHIKWHCIDSEVGAFIPHHCLVPIQFNTISLDHVSLVTNLIQTMAHWCPQTLAYYLWFSQYHSSTRSSQAWFCPSWGLLWSEKMVYSSARPLLCYNRIWIILFGFLKTMGHESNQGQYSYIKHFKIFTLRDTPFIKGRWLESKRDKRFKCSMIYCAMR